MKSDLVPNPSAISAMVGLRTAKQAPLPVAGRRLQFEPLKAPTSTARQG